MKYVLSVLCLTFYVLASGQDYYSGKTELQGKKTVYKVDNYPCAVTLSNKSNRHKQFEDFAYYTDTGERIVNSPHLGLNNQVFDFILESVFSPSELSLFKDSKNYIEFCLVVNPTSGKVDEIKYITLENDCRFGDPIYLSIPITKIEMLETLIKERIIYEVPDKYKTANFLNQWERAFFDMEVRNQR